MSAFEIACVIVGLSVLANLAGIAMFQRVETFVRGHNAYLTNFAAGVLVTMVLLRLAPHAIHSSHLAPIAILAGYILILLLDQFMTTEVYSLRQPKLAPKIAVPLIGIGLHSLFDGVIHSSTFNVSVSTGLGAAAGLILHEIPEAILVYSFVRRAGIAQTRAMLWTIAIAGLTTPLGMLVTFSSVATLPAEEQGTLLGLAAGVLLYVGATHLLPEAKLESRRFHLPSLILGVLLAAGLVLFSH